MWYIKSYVGNPHRRIDYSKCLGAVNEVPPDNQVDFLIRLDRPTSFQSRGAKAVEECEAPGECPNR